MKKNCLTCYKGQKIKWYLSYGNPNFSASIKYEDIPKCYPKDRLDFGDAQSGILCDLRDGSVWQDAGRSLDNCDLWEPFRVEYIERNIEE